MENNNTNLKICINGFAELEQARESILNFCSHYCRSDEVIDILEMAILEACHNAILYSTKRKNKSLCELKLSFDNQSIKAIVINYGKAFKVLEKESFSIEQDFLQYKNGGLGIPLIKSLVDSVEYSRRSDGTNELIILKKINK
ncbi:ATP-binding protein [bacterium]|nr:ATP-binding protein [bacterium]